jgi:hypothetical protein
MTIVQQMADRLSRITKMFQVSESDWSEAISEFLDVCASSCCHLGTAV